MPDENLFIPKEGALACLDAILAATVGPVAARLYDNDIAYNPDRVLSDYNEASFAGYSAVDPIAWGSPFTNPGGKAEADSGVCSWTFTGGSGTAIVYGIILTDSSKTTLIAVIPFVPAVTLSPGSPTVARSIQFTDVSEL